MTAPASRDALAAPGARARAWRELMIVDHGLIRLLYRNVHEIAPGKMWRSYQPSPGDLRHWAKRGVRTIVNLRGKSTAGHYLLEEEACRRLGLNLVDFRVYSRAAPSKELLRAASRLFSEIDYPAVMHCKSGADRVGLMAALYVFFVERRPFDEALGQLAFRYGHVRQGKVGVIDHALEGFLAWSEKTGASLSSEDDFFRWVETDYDPERAQREFMATWWGTLLTERIWRRE